MRCRATLAMVVYLAGASAVGLAQETPLGAPLTDAELVSIRRQIVSCWSMPAPSTGDLPAVRVRFSLNRDGSLRTSPEPLPADIRDDAAYRVALGAVQRAIARCMPLKDLPSDKYGQWENIDMVFNPRLLPAD